MSDPLEVITPHDLKSSLGSRYRGDSLVFLLALVNGVVADAWDNPVDPVPARVKAIALTVAERRYDNPRGLSSWTISAEDSSRTERIDKAQRAGVYLTDEETADLNGDRGKRRRRYGTLRTRIGY